MVGILTNFLKSQRTAHVLPYLDGKILDLGCGDSPVLSRLSSAEQYVGIDSRPEMIQWLRQHHPQAAFHCRDLDREPLDLNARFDTVLMLAVIEHLERPSYILSQLPAILTPGGAVVLTTPTPFGNQIHHAGAKLRLFSSEAADEHKFIFNEKTMRKLLESSGLDLVHHKRFLLGQNQLFVAQAKSR